MTPVGKYVASGGVLGTLIAAVIGTWYVLTRDVHAMKEIPPDALPMAPAQGRTGWKRVDALLPKLQSVAQSTGIPLGLMVGWIAKESGGKLAIFSQPGKADTDMGERGYWQLTPEESKALGIDHERLSVDADYSLQSGTGLIRHYQSAVNDLNLPAAPAGSSMYWRLVKLGHSVGGGQLKKIVSAARAAGQVGSWEQLEQFALGMSIRGPQPKKWFPFIDDTRSPTEKNSVYRVGRPFGFGTETSAPALVGICCGFDILDFG